MIQIPQPQWQQSNNSDKFGNISSTRNINLDNEGYLSLASRSFSVWASGGDAPGTSAIGTILGIGRYSEGDFIAMTSGSAILLSLSNTTFTNDEDTRSNNPNGAITSWGTFWQNRYYCSEQTNVVYKAIGSGVLTAWVSAAITLTTGLTHAMEVFRNKKTLCITNGNTVLQVNTSHAATTDLVLPSDYEAIGLAYSNNKMGIVTRLTNTIEGQGQDAYFFVWDGNTASAGQGVPIGSDSAVAIAAYKGTWVILTRTGQLLIWNGSGFQQLAAFPFYYKGQYWGGFLNKVGYGQMIVVEGDLIYLNVEIGITKSGRNQENYLPGNPSGIWCFDPAVGLYHRYSPSMSYMQPLTVSDSGVNTTTNILTKATGTVPSTGSIVRYTNAGGTPIGGLQERRDYYVIQVTSTTFKLATTYQNAIEGTAIDLTSVGASTNNFLSFEILDYGAVNTSGNGAIAFMGVSDQYADHLIYGHEVYNPDGTGYKHFQVTVPYIENRGEIVTAKLFPDSKEAIKRNLVIKFKPLTGTDTIVVKEKSHDLTGLPVSTIQNNTNGNCTWTNPREFYTSSVLEDVVTAFDAGNEIECLVLSGVGAGTLVKVESIVADDGVYSIVLEEDVIGVSSGLFSDVQFDNFSKYATIDVNSPANQKGYIEAPIGNNSKWSLYKLELRGVKVTIEELGIDNVKHS